MGVRGGYDVGTRGMDPGMNRERRAVDRILPFHHLAMVIYQNEIGGTDLTEVHAERVDPEMIEHVRDRGR